jgi:purine-binding chemotaxis protein CheW
MASDENDNSGGAITQWVTFSLENETYGINVMNVQEVLPMTDIAEVPGAPAYVMGIINLRGNVVTVIDTRMRFGLKSRGTDDTTRIVVVETAKQVAGILVDSVAEVVEVKENQIDSAPTVGNEESSRYLLGVVSRKDGLLILVDVNKLLTDEEWRDVAAATPG